MNPRFVPATVASILLLALPVAPVRAQESPAASEEAALRAVIEGFHAALASGDSAAALGHLHPEVAVFESGHAEDLEEYRSGHLAADIEFSKTVSFDTIRDTVVPAADLALYLREYAVKGTFRDREIDAHGVETMVLERTPAGWKIRHIHWSSR